MRVPNVAKSLRVAHSWYEATLGSKARAHVIELDLPAEVAAASCQLCHDQRLEAGRPARGRRPTSCELGRQRIAPVEQESGVTRQDPVEIVASPGERAIGVEKTHRRSGPDVAPHSEDVEHCLVVSTEQRFGTLVYSAQVSHVERPDLSRQLRAADRVGDPARVHQVSGRAEDFGALQEKRSFFREEQGKALVDRDPVGVRLDLGKVGIDRGVEHEVLSDTVATVHAKILRKPVPHELTVRLLSPADTRCDRIDLHQFSGFDIPQAHELTGLGQRAGDVAGQRRPRLLEFLSAHPSRDTQAPVLHADFAEA